MTNKEKIARLFEKNIHLIKCPFCNSSMKVAELKSLVCINNHTFDIAKQGYVNLLTRPVISQYDKNLFQTRRNIITESDFFTPLHQKVVEFITTHINYDIENPIIFDAGCGEGSHLTKILSTLKNTMTGIGLDISKEGIQMAARYDKESIWLVGDLANTPLTDESCHVILNILSPANYQEFNRLLAPKGVVIKVVPRTKYLRELRETLNLDEKKPQTNEKIIDLFKEHFHITEKVELSYTKKLEKAEFVNLVQMSPLSWNVGKEELNKVIDLDISEMTVDLDLLIGINN